MPAVDLRSILQLHADGVPLRGTERGLLHRRNLERLEQATHVLAAESGPTALGSGAEIDVVEFLFLSTDQPVNVFFGNNDTDGLSLGAGAVLFWQGGNLAVNPPILGGIKVQVPGASEANVNVAIGGRSQGI